MRADSRHRVEAINGLIARGQLAHVIELIDHDGKFDGIAAAINSLSVEDYQAAAACGWSDPNSPKPLISLRVIRGGRQ